MPPVPAPPADMMVMPANWQHLFTLMQGGPILAFAVFSLWAARKHGSLVPVWLFLGGAVAYAIEPLLGVLGLIWYPPEGQVVALHTLGRSVPVFGLLAYFWFLGGATCYAFHRIRTGITRAALWRMYFVLFVVESCLEIPGLQLGVFAYYGNQPFVLLKFPLWWATLNAAVPIVTASIVHALLPHIKPLFRPLTVYAVPVCNAMVMSSASLPVLFTLNRSESLVVTHVAGAIAIATACAFVFAATLLASREPLTIP